MVVIIGAHMCLASAIHALTLRGQALFYCSLYRSTPGGPREAQEIQPRARSQWWSWDSNPRSLAQGLNFDSFEKQWAGMEGYLSKGRI